MGPAYLLVGTMFDGNKSSVLAVIDPGTVLCLIIHGNYLNQSRWLSIGPRETSYSEILVKIYQISFVKINLKTSRLKCQPFFADCNALNDPIVHYSTELFGSYLGPDKSKVEHDSCNDCRGIELNLFVVGRVEGPT